MVTCPTVDGPARLLVPVTPYNHGHTRAGTQTLMHHTRAHTHTRIVVRPMQCLHRCVPQAEMKILDKTINVEREKRKQEYVAHPARLLWRVPHLKLSAAALQHACCVFLLRCRYAAEVLRAKIEADAARIKAMEEEKQRMQKERQENAKRILYVAAGRTAPMGVRGWWLTNAVNLPRRVLTSRPRVATVID